MEPVSKLFVATKAFLVYNKKVLILRESNQYQDGANSGRYDVVGGRIEPGQRYDNSLLREIKEETGLSATIEKPFFVGEWRPKVKGEQWQIVGIYFICLADSPNVILSNDHDTFEWISPKFYTKYNLIDTVRSAFAAYLNQ